VVDRAGQSSLVEVGHEVVSGALVQTAASCQYVYVVEPCEQRRRRLVHRAHYRAALLGKFATQVYHLGT
jgi:hypothetical protein